MKKQIGSAIFMLALFCGLSVLASEAPHQAVGYYRLANNNIAPLSYATINGGAVWTLSNRLPLPNDVASNGVQNSRLQSVFCDTTGVHCTAVGFYLTASNNITPLSYFSANGGVTWSLSNPLPLPSNVAKGLQQSELLGIACSSTGSRCSAVGFYRTFNNDILPLSYVSANGGNAWTLGGVFPLPNDVASSGLQNSKLQSVFCDTTGAHCSTAGSYLSNSNNVAPLTYTTLNGGVAWSIGSKLPIPADVAAVGNQQSMLVSEG